MPYSSIILSLEWKAFNINLEYNIIKYVSYKLLKKLFFKKLYFLNLQILYYLLRIKNIDNINMIENLYENILYYKKFWL